MRDMFDEFMEELRRREAERAGIDPDAPRPDPVDPEGGEGGGGNGGGDDDGPPRRRRPRTRRRESPGGGARALAGRFGCGFVLLAFFVVLSLLAFGLDLWTDAIWYASVGYDAVFWTRVGTEAALFLGVGAFAVALLLGNLWLAGRLAPPASPDQPGAIRSLFDRLNEAAGQFESYDRYGRPRGPGPRPVVVSPDELPDITPLANLVIASVAVLVALGVAGAAAGGWETVQLYLHRAPFGTPDPIFARDIGYFLFELPFQRFLQSLLNGLLLGGLVVALARYVVASLRGGLVFATPVRVHLAVFAGLYLLSVAAGYQLDKLELVYSTRGVATGVSFTDQHAQFFAYDALTVISGLAAALLVGGAFSRLMWPLGLALGVWFLASILLGRLYPEVIERFTVQPNQLAQEQPYIANNIAMTRLAYGLDLWDERDYRGEAALTREAIDQEEATFRNARLWDYRPLGLTLDQLQTVRQYYDFVDVDTDRYRIGDEVRQVMLAARELALEKNPTATNWVNQRITFTHGFGVAMVPVNEVAGDGQPRLLVSNLPPVSAPGAPEIDQAQIYFGERPSDYVVTGARQDEFDYPAGPAEGSGQRDVQTRWTGTTGIRLDTTLSRLLFALRFRDLNLLISDQVTADSQLLFHRSLSDRVPRIAPFLRYDKDPYVVVRDDGSLVYIWDAYTTSDRFPNADWFDPGDLPAGTGFGGSPFNYVRNSVKVVVDAYDGTVTYYVADPSEPIVKAYGGVFPTLFRPLDELPADLRSHLRVPEELFNVQTRMYGRYHVDDAATFFRRDDLWAVPVATDNEQALPPEPYYVIMRMPGEEASEFLLLQPMVPTSRPNMIAWVAARNDPEHYGQTRVYRFPSDTTIFGPAQIEARIDQDPIISAQITLWNASGSRVIRGNLIVVPVGDSILYLQPVYLQSTSTSFPQFQRIVVASPTRVVWGSTLAEALNLMLAGGPGPTPTPSPGPSPSPGPTPSPTVAPSPTATPSPGPGATLPPDDVAALIEFANTHFELAQEALREGDFARYGEEIALVEQALARLEVLAGPSPSP